MVNVVNRLAPRTLYFLNCNYHYILKQWCYLKTNFGIVFVSFFFQYFMNMYGGCKFSYICVAVLAHTTNALTDIVNIRGHFTHVRMNIQPLLLRYSYQNNGLWESSIDQVDKVFIIIVVTIITIVCISNFLGW